MKTIKYILIFFAVMSISCKETRKPETKRESDPRNSVIHLQQTKKVIPADGYYTEKYDNGSVKMEGMMKNNKRTGIWKAWHPNGNLWSEAFYENGLREGDATVFYENGKKMYQGAYKNDEQVGVWQFYDEQGTLIKEIQKTR